MVGGTPTTRRLPLDRSRGFPLTHLRKRYLGLRPWGINRGGRPCRRHLGHSGIPLFSAPFHSPFRRMRCRSGDRLPKERTWVLSLGGVLLVLFCRHGQKSTFHIGTINCNLKNELNRYASFPAPRCLESTLFSGLFLATGQKMLSHFAYICVGYCIDKKKIS